MKRALVLSLALIFGLGIATFAQGVLTGEWDTTITIYPNTTPLNALTLSSFLDFNTKLTINYEVGGWKFTSYSELADAGWTKQYFKAAGSFGFFNVSSKLDFVTTGAFKHLAVDVTYLWGNVDFTLDIDLEPNDLRVCIGGGATTGLVDITINACFGDLTYDAVNAVWVNSGDMECDLDWAGIDITIGFPFCCADVAATISFDCGGFVMACFGVTGIDIPNLPWVDIDAKVCFQTESKTLTLTPKFDFGVDVCFDLFICQQSGSKIVGPAGGPLTLGDFYIAGIELTCEIGGVSFTGVSFWGDKCATLRKGTLLNKTTYWEAYKIATTGTGDCCGPFNFDLTVFFSETSTSLFDVAAFKANFSYAFGANFTFKMGFDYTALTGLTKWVIGVKVTW